MNQPHQPAIINTEESKQASFHLSKWYLDCVSDEGTTAIGYSARLRWKALALAYSSYLNVDRENERSERTSFLQCRQPEVSADGITWQSNTLSCHGNWRPLQKGLPPVILYEGSAGAVTWHCLQPLSAARFHAGQANYGGLGYVERLEMTLAPWQLPLKELHWGRFLSCDTYLVWIQWRGPHPLTHVYLNGVNIDTAEVGADRLSWMDGHLDLREQTVLRNGPIVKTALARLPGAGSVFPEAMLLANECKWLSRGALVHRAIQQTGWVIHEIVRFG